jgi:membrane fusion protein (multidrug efflux system)
MRLLTFIAVLALAACSHPVAANPRSDAALPQVEVVRVVSQKLSTVDTLPAELAPWEAVAVYPKVRGFIEEIPVDRGSIVRRGDLLVRLSAPELLADTAQAEANLRADQSTYERLRNAAKTKGAVSENELELAREKALADQQHVRAMKAQAGYLSITAPFDAVVTERNVHPGALVGPPTEPLHNAVPMLRIEHIAHLRLTVAVPEADAGAIALGASVKFRVKAWPAREFTATISRVAHSVDESTRSMAVEADVDNRDRALAPGMFAEVTWPVRRATPTLFVPATAVVDSSERTFVDRVRGGRIEQVAVQRGRAMGGMVEVFGGGLAPSDLVAVHGSEDLSDGAQVTVRGHQS